MENETLLINQANPQKKLSPKKTLILIIALAIIGFLFWLFSGNPTTGQAQLSWNVNTEPDLAGYRIYYGISKRTDDCPPGGYHDKIDVGKTATPEKPSYKIENLADGKTYYFSITSYDASDNESCFSDEMSKTIK